MDISRSDLLSKTCERRSKQVTIGGVDYYLRSLTAREWTECQAILGFSTDRKHDAFEYKSALLIAMLTDKAGNVLLLPDDAEALGKMPPVIIESLVDAAQLFLDEDLDTFDDAKKN